MRGNSQTLGPGGKGRNRVGQSLEDFLEEESLRPLCCPTPSPRFCLMVKKGYRDPPYHNWMHAFSVSHFCYLLYKNLELTNYLE